MGKQYYIDANKTIPRTSLKLYNHSIDQLEKTEAVREAYGMTKEVQGGYHAIASDLQEALLCGQESAAPVLAYLCYHGYGMKKDIEKVKLFILIGENLGNPTCVNFMRGQNDDSLDIKGFLQSKPVYSSKLQQKALLYTTAIKNGIRAYISSENEMLSDEKLCDIDMHLKSIDPDHTLTILGDDSGSSSCCCM